MSSLRSKPMRVMQRGCAAAALVSLASASASAQDKAHEAPQVQQVQVEIDRLAQDAFQVDDSDPERSVPSMEQAMRKPLQMGYFVILLIERGKTALDRNDAKAAVKYYRALVKAVPERSQSYALLCKAYEAQGDLQSAVENCRTALGKDGVTVEDNLRFVDVMLKKPTALSTKDIEDVEAVAGHLEKELGPDKDGPAIAQRLRCGLGVRLEDIARLEDCTGELRKLAPQDAATIAFSWALALKKRDFEAAKGVMADAKAAGLPRHALRKMEEGLVQAREGVRWWRDWSLLAGVALLAAGAVFLIGLYRRRTLTAGHAS